MTKGNGQILTEEEVVRASVASQKFKTVTMQQIIRNRETRKVPKLKEILKEALDAHQKKKAAKRQREKQQTVEDILNDDTDFMTDY